MGSNPARRLEAQVHDLTVAGDLARPVPSLDDVQDQVKKLEARLSPLGQRLEELAAKADSAKSSAAKEYRRGVDDLKSRYEAAHAHLAALRSASGGAWETLKTRTETACRELEDAFKALTHG